MEVQYEEFVFGGSNFLFSERLVAVGGSRSGSGSSS
jgi:hypothetical protein